MPSLEPLSFQDPPPFPDTVPTAPLLKISLSKLLAHDAEEEGRLWNACCDLGFFYLDLRPDESSTNEHSNGTNGHSNGHSNGTNGHYANQPKIDGQSLLHDADQLFSVGTELFELPVSEKQTYDFSSKGSYMGYKGYGSGIIDKKGTKDRNEFYNVAKDDIMGVSQEPLAAPQLLEKYRLLLKSYITSAHALITFVLALLNERLELPPRTLENLHRLNAAAGDQVRFIKAPPQPKQDRRTALGAHSDFGSVTVLFNRLGGLQVRLPNTIAPVPAAREPETDEEKAEVAALTKSDIEDRGPENWAYVRPLPGHAIINLGDAMVKFTKGILRSNIHRVVSPPGIQGDETRYSLVYFSRPEDDVLLGPLRESAMIDDRCGDGEEDKPVKSKEWILRRGLGRRLGGKWEDSVGTEDARGAKG